MTIRRLRSASQASTQRRNIINSRLRKPMTETDWLRCKELQGRRQIPTFKEARPTSSSTLPARIDSQASIHLTRSWPDIMATQNLIRASEPAEQSSTEETANTSREDLGHATSPFPRSSSSSSSSTTTTGNYDDDEDLGPFNDRLDLSPEAWWWWEPREQCATPGPELAREIAESKRKQERMRRKQEKHEARTSTRTRTRSLQTSWEHVCLEAKKLWGHYRVAPALVPHGSSVLSRGQIFSQKWLTHYEDEPAVKVKARTV